MYIGIFSAFFAALLAAPPAVTIQAERLSDQPVLKPAAPPWMEAGAFNPAAAMVDGKTVLLFRARDAHGTSRIGYAASADGLHFKIDPRPVLEPAEPYESGGGVEDPRVLRIGTVYYMTYTGYNLHDAQLCLATSPDLRHWRRHGVILPAYHGTWTTGWTKSGAIVPERINAKWWMYYLGTRHDSDGKDRDYMGLASSADLLHWTDATSQPVLERRPGDFDDAGDGARAAAPGDARRHSAAIQRRQRQAGVWSRLDLIRQSRSPACTGALRQSIHAPEPPVGTRGNGAERDFSGRRDGRGPGDALDLTGYYGGADQYTGAMRIRIGVQ